MKKKRIIILFVIFIICILVTILYNLKNRNDKIAESFKVEISEYLEKFYSEEFDIKFFRKGYKKKMRPAIDATPIYYGKDIIEYFKSK